MCNENKIYKVISNGFKIYPINKGSKFAVCIEDSRNAVYKKKKTVGEFKHSTKTINKAILKSIDHVFLKLTNTNTK